MAFKEARQNTQKPSGKGGKVTKSVTPKHEEGSGKPRARYELPKNGPQKKGNR